MDTYLPLPLSPVALSALTSDINHPSIHLHSFINTLALCACGSPRAELEPEPKQNRATGHESIKFRSSSLVLDNQCHTLINHIHPSIYPHLESLAPHRRIPIQTSPE